MTAKNSKVFSTYADYLTFQMHWVRSSEMKCKEEILGQEKFIKKNFKDFKKDIKILDCACGDGIGLKCFKSLGFKNVAGLDLQSLQIKRSREKQTGFKVIKGDMHKTTSIFHPSSFDIIYSSHTLEHAFSPDQVVHGFYDILRLFGLLFIVLPYPDDVSDAHRNKAHCGSKELGLNVEDKGITVTDFFLKRGFALSWKKLTQFRESEIWLKLEKVL